MGARRLYSHADGYQCEVAAATDRVCFTDSGAGPGEHHYVVRGQSIADELPVGPLVAYSSPTYVRSGSEGNGSA